MAKQMIYKTVICKVNGITLLDLNHGGTHMNYINNITPIHNKPCGDDGSHDDNEDNKLDTSATNADDGQDGDGEDHLSVELDFDNNADNDDVANNELADDVEANGDVDDDSGRPDMADDDDDDYEPVTTIRRVGVKDAVRYQKVRNGIESVRQYVNTTRKGGKVWHTCLWQTDRGRTCGYGSKWSGAMVNHIRSHLGIKPFGCGYCEKEFTIACNLKNHLRIHHGLKAKIILNGGRRRREERVVVTDNINADNRSANTYRSVVKSGSNKLRIFKPSFMNGKAANNDYALNRGEHKRSVKKVQRYGNFIEDMDELSDQNDDEVNDNNDDEEEDHKNNMDEEEAEEENRMFYEKTNKEEKEAVDEEEEDEGKDEEDSDLSRLLTKRRYNKVLWFVCLWNPKQCKYRSHQRAEVMAHLKKHQNIGRFVCNWNHCSASFLNKSLLEDHQVIHKKQQPFTCNFKGCSFQTINERTLQMHKIRHKRRLYYD